MRSRRFLIAGGLIAVAVAGSCSGETEATGPGFAGAAGACATDMECPPGEECVNGGCVPMRPTLYSHIQTGVMLFRGPIDADESAWCATHYDVVIGGGRPDEIRPLNPNARLFEYTLTRFHTFESGEKSASAWALANGWDPEDFYLHYREDVSVPTWEGRVIVPGFAPGMVPGWNPGGGGGPASATERAQSRVVGFYAGRPEPTYFANLEHPGFRQFFVQRTAGLIDGTWYFNRPYATGPLEGIMCDEAVYYPSFREGLLDRSREYYGIPLTDTHPYAIALQNLYPFLSQSLSSAVGATVDVMPNYGNVLFLNYPNPAARTIQTTTPWILGEVWVTFTGASFPTSGANGCITFEKDYENAVRKIVEQSRTRGRRVLGARDTSNGFAGSPRGRIFTLALYYLIHNRNTYYMYESADQLPTDVATWAWNPAVEFDVGQPATIPPGAVDFEGRPNTKEHWVFAAGPDPYRPDLTYYVLARRFTNALVLVKLMRRGSVDDGRSTTTHALDGSFRVLDADGTLGLVVTEARLRNNEALILIPDASTGVD